MNMLHRTAALLLAAAALTACSTSPDMSQMRNGPQAVHPGSTAAPVNTRSRAPQNRLGRAQANAQANTLFDKYCLSGRSNKGIEAALRASGQFQTPNTLTTRLSRYVSYPLADGRRGAVTLVYNSGGGIRCAAGIENVGPVLYDDGRVLRSKA